MKYYDLSQEEQAELEQIESGEFSSVADIEKAKKEAVRMAKNSIDSK